MSFTPRTDRAEQKTIGGIGIVSADFARKLERELAVTEWKLSKWRAMAVTHTSQAPPRAYAKQDNKQHVSHTVGETPRTDGLEADYRVRWSSAFPEEVFALARDLERELNVAKWELRKWVEIYESPPTNLPTGRAAE